MTTLAPPPTERRAPRQHRRSPWIAVILLAALAITLAGIFPFRQMIAQDRQVDATEARLAALVEQNEDLEARITALNSDAEIERMAREQGLVRPGETGYALEFEETTPQVAPTVPPLVDGPDRSLLGQIWDFLTGRDLDPDE